MKAICILFIMLFSGNLFGDLGVTSITQTESGSGSTSAGCIFINFRLQAAGTGITIGNTDTITNAFLTLPIYGDYFGGSGSRLPSIPWTLVGGSQTLIITEVK